jgi:hypothetical protein
LGARAGRCGERGVLLGFRGDPPSGGCGEQGQGAAPPRLRASLRRGALDRGPHSQPAGEGPRSRPYLARAARLAPDPRAPTWRPGRDPRGSYLLCSSSSARSPRPRGASCVGASVGPARVRRQPPHSMAPRDPHPRRPSRPAPGAGLGAARRASGARGARLGLGGAGPARGGGARARRGAAWRPLGSPRGAILGVARGQCEGRWPGSAASRPLRLGLRAGPALRPPRPRPS